MKRPRHLLPVLLLLIAGVGALPAQDRSSRDAAEPRHWSHWISSDELVLRVRGSDSTRYFFGTLGLPGQSAVRLFDHTKFAAALADASGRPVNASAIAIEVTEYTRETARLEFRAFGSTWSADLKSMSIRKRRGRQRSSSSDLPMSLQVRPSKRIGGRTEIIFVNRLNFSVVVYWNDSNSELRKYATLQPGETHTQRTFHGDAWVIQRAEDEKVVAVCVGAAEPARAVIQPVLVAEKETSRKRMSADELREAAAENSMWEAFCRDENLWLRDKRTREERRLTYDGTQQLTWHKDVDRDRGVSMRYNKPDAPPEACEVYWSPDGAWLLAIRTRTAPLPHVNLIESSPGPGMQPKLSSYPYYKPGDEIPTKELRLFEAASGREVLISNAQFANPFSMTRIRWDDDSSRFRFLYNERGHQIVRYVGVSTSGAVTLIANEVSDTFVDYAYKLYIRDLPESSETIWMSERDGWNHLYLLDSSNGRVKQQITRGTWVVRSVHRVDEESRQIYFTAGGVDAEQDPYYVHLCRVNVDGTGFRVLTEADGTHEFEFGPDDEYFLDKYSRVDLPPRYEMRSRDGDLIARFPDVEFETRRRPLPQRFVARGRDGETDIYGVIHFPRDFDPDRRYPVIENIYAGPHAAHVPKRFRSRYRHQHQIADRGFIVVQIDGMGTSHRSKAFHDVCWQNIADAGFPDRIAWMKAAAAEHSFMDLSRVGIYGGSAGGQNALGALLHHGDFYHVAVADCGCHDNRMDKIWWNELWMGWPVGPHYDEQSNVTNAHKLRGQLLLVVGELDRNVDPASTMQVVNALIEADKDFDLLVVPGGGHGIAESAYGSRRRADFFVRHLLETE